MLWRRTCLLKSNACVPADGVTFLPVRFESKLYALGVRFGFTAFSIALGSSYFQVCVCYLFIRQPVVFSSLQNDRPTAFQTWVLGKNGSKALLQRLDCFWRQLCMPDPFSLSYLKMQVPILVLIKVCPLEISTRPHQWHTLMHKSLDLASLYANVAL